LGTVGDSILIAQRHTPVAALITERFWIQSEMVARSFGLPDLPRVALPYPIAGTGTVAIDAAALDAVSAVLGALGL
jgi:hypothetical protein